MPLRYPSSTNLRHVICTVLGFGLFLVCCNTFLLWKFPAPWRIAHRTRPTGLQPEDHHHHHHVHPIEILMLKAETSYEELLARRSNDVHAAAAEYRARRGRHPPPGFDAWFEYARQNSAVMIEELFDQIYRDMNPFWGVSPGAMRDFTAQWDDLILVENGTASITSTHDAGTPHDRMTAWLEAVQNMEHLLPDLRMAVNVMDEGRVVVPWEDIDEYMGEERRTRRLIPAADTISKFQQVNEAAVDQSSQHLYAFLDPDKRRFWDVVRLGCPPQAPARYRAAATSFRGPPLLPPHWPTRSLQGYVTNWTYVRDPCEHPLLQETHGSFVEPVSISVTDKLVPIFGESKLSVNNDILIPPAAYLSSNFSSGLYSDADSHGGTWSDKKGSVMWRGVASGGRNREENWTRFHRHRFVSMLNGTYVRQIEISPTAVGQGQNFRLPSYATYHLQSAKRTDLGTWLNEIADVGFTRLLCWPPTEEPTCNYTDAYFKIMPQVPMAEQYNSKLLPDIDGNSFSGRYLAFLRSTSVPVKATIYSEWHDDRLIPWLHFIPMDNTFVDVYGILDYFIGTDENEARDDAARKIAIRGKEWAKKVLRKEDMQIYLFRLLLEYARLCDDNREVLGFVEDLKEAKTAAEPPERPLAQRGNQKS
ncbi:hypothetical protein ACN47E_009501 [Coniothyrium glycines]